MTTRADQPDDTPNTASLPFIEGLRALEGEEMPEDQDAVLDTDEVEHERQSSRTEFDHLDPDLSAVRDPDEEGAILLTSVLAPSGLRDGETDDAGAAAQEGLTWVPPIDPPVIPDPGRSGHRPARRGGNRDLGNRSKLRHIGDASSRRGRAQGACPRGASSRR